MSDEEQEQFDDTEEQGEEEEAIPGDDAELEKLGDEEAEDEEKEDQEPEEQEEEEKDPDMPLSEEIVGECLSLLCKTGDGLAHAYVRLDVHERELTDISILKTFIHLRYVDLSKNNLRDLSPLNGLTHLLTIKADYNKLSSAKMDEMPYLQIASFTNNRIKTTEGINHPLLEHINLNYNEITLVSGLDNSKLSRLHTLELRGNKLETTDGIYLPNLKNLFLAANTIKKIEGLDRLEHLATLHLRDNQLEDLDGFSENLKNLQYLNLRGNNLAAKEVKKLQCLPMLRALALAENPASDDDDYRLEVLINLRKIERLDKEEYTEEERQEAEEVYEQRRQDELAAQLEGDPGANQQEVIHSDTEEQ